MPNERVLQHQRDEPASGTVACEPLDWRGTERFHVIRCIGRGGMGTVYEARDEHRQIVALKTVLHVDPASVYQFKQEFRVLAGVIHPNLVRLHELVMTEGDRVFFSMELIRGTDFLRHVQKTGTAPRLDESGIQTGAPRRMSSRPPSALAERRPTPADIDRLLPALRQLVAGVLALHEAGKLHRDIKPSNVLVTTEGRVVVLDFGVATDLRRAARESGDPEQMVGTATYMAPEQALDGEAPGTAADWYSVGVMLYESLVGDPPFVGPAVDVIQRKNVLDARSPSEVVDGVPAELDALCRELLDRTPERRPTGPEILRRLGASGAAARGVNDERRPVALVGREAQLKELDDALARVGAGRPVTVRVSGRAGMGKSALVQSFLDRAVEQSGAVVLTGRAYERESLPYKAIDSAIDALSRHLVHLADHGDTLSFPADVGALAHLFPVLRRVPGIDRTPEEPPGDPARTRRRAFGALREVLGKLARKQRLILHIDDAQWGDTDSAALLLDLVRPPNAPPILIVMAHREEDATTAPFPSELRMRWPAGAEVRDVSVGPLDPEGTRRLALALVGPRSEAEQKLADAVARESGGNPFLVGELAREAPARFLNSAEGSVTFEQVVAARLTELSAEARRLAEVVAVAGRPLPLSLLGEASGTEAVDELVSLLAVKRFVRPGLRDGREVAEPIHDRIRETVVALMPEDVVRGHHVRLARVLEDTPGAEPEAVAIHLLGAGETERAGRFALRAADRAAKLLAFDQAARLYQLAIDTARMANAGPIYARLGEVLGWAGRHEQSGRAYIAAAEAAEPGARGPLERAAAAQLLAAGRIDEGGAMLRRVLAGAGVELPGTLEEAFASLKEATTTLQTLVRRFDERNPDDVPGAVGARIDAMHVGALGLASVDIILSVTLQARQLVEALRAGDRARTVRAAILYYGSSLAQRGGPVSAHERDVQALIERLVAKGGSAEELAFSRGTYGVSLYIRGRWREAVEVIDAAYANLPSQQASMQSQAVLYALFSLASMGRLVELRRRAARLRVDAEQRGDLFTLVMLSVSHPFVLKLADDDPEGARAALRDAEGQWSHGKYLLQDSQVMRAEAEIELYLGNGAAAYERIKRDELPLEKSLLLNTQLVRAFTVFVAGRAAIASMDAAGAPRSDRLAEANLRAAALRGEQMPWADTCAAMLTACIKNAEGQRDEALVALREAIAHADATDMMLHAATARHRLGLLLGGAEGERELHQAEETMRAQGVRVPAKFASMYVPGRW
jgi:hypothetical protein